MASENKQLVDDFQIKPITMEDKPLVYEFSKKYFFTSEPLNEAMNSAGKGMLRTLRLEDWPMPHLLQELSFMAVTPVGEIIGISTAEIKIKSTQENETKNSKSEDFSIIYNLLNGINQQITLLANLKDNEKEMEVRSVTVHENWRNKGVGRKLLEQSRKLALEKGFKQMRSICTSAYTAKMFANCGFECIYALSYEDCKKQGKIIDMPRQPHTHIKGMVLKL